MCRKRFESGKLENSYGADGKLLVLLCWLWYHSCVTSHEKFVSYLVAVCLICGAIDPARGGTLPAEPPSSWRTAAIRDTHAAFKAMKGYPACPDAWADMELLKVVPPGMLHLVIYLKHQRGLLYAHEQVVMDFPVCSGAEKTPTPQGKFTILEKDRDHYSNLYDRLAMPCFLRLTKCGIGLHVGPVFREPASHGCIRLPRQVGTAIFNKVLLGTPVHIVGECVIRCKK